MMGTNELMTLTHADSVLAVTFLNHPSRIVTGCQDHHIRLFETESFTRVGTLKGHTRSVLALAAVSEHDILFSSGGDRMLRLWSTRPPMQCLAVIPIAESNLLSLTARSHDGNIYCFGGGQDTKIYQVVGPLSASSLSDRKELALDKKLRVKPLGRHLGFVFACSLATSSANDLSVLSGGGDSFFKVWKVPIDKEEDGNDTSGGEEDLGKEVVKGNEGKLELQRSLSGHHGTIYCVAVSNNDFFTGGQDKTIRVWDRQTLQCRHVLTGHLGEVVTLTYCDSSDEGLPSRFHYNRSPFSKGLKPLKMRGGRGYLVSGADDGGVKIWSASTYACLRSFFPHKAASVFSVALSGPLLLTSGGDDAVKCWYLPHLLTAVDDAHGPVLPAPSASQPNGPIAAAGFSGSDDWPRFSASPPLPEPRPAYEISTSEYGEDKEEKPGLPPKQVSANASDHWTRETLPHDEYCASALGEGMMATIRSHWDRVWASYEEEASSSRVTLQHAVPLSYLSHLVQLASVSCDPSLRYKCWDTAKSLHTLFESLGAQTQMVQTAGGHNPVVLAKFESSPLAPTVLVHGHYDVQPADIRRGWIASPFELTGKDGYLYGRGVMDNKGPILAAILAATNCLRYLDKNAESNDKDDRNALKLNVVFALEGEGENGSSGFLEALQSSKEWLGNVFMCLNTNGTWLDDTHPCITTGLRGRIQLQITVTHGRGGSTDPRDFHSGTEDGTHEPMVDLAAVIASLVDENTGKVAVEGFYDNVGGPGDLICPRAASSSAAEGGFEAGGPKDPTTEQEPGEGAAADSSEAHAAKRQRVSSPHDNPRGSYPSLSVHGVTVSNPNDTVIPYRCTASISIRTVPFQEPSKIVEKLEKHIRTILQRRRSPNAFFVRVTSKDSWWLQASDNIFVAAASHSAKAVWDVEPRLIRDGGTLRMTPMVEQILRVPAIQLPLAEASSRPHLPNERMKLFTLVKGQKTIEGLLLRVAVLSKYLGKPEEPQLGSPA